MQNDAMKLRISGRSTRGEYVTPAQLPFVTKELTASTTLVPPSTFGPPESPKHVPPLPCAGFAVSLMNSGLITSLL